MCLKMEKLMNLSRYLPILLSNVEDYFNRNNFASSIKREKFTCNSGLIFDKINPSIMKMVLWR